MVDRMRFEPGFVSMRRNLNSDGRISFVHCGRVISDDERGLLQWVHPGSHTVGRHTLDGRSTRKLPLAEKMGSPTVLTVRRWHGTGVLQLTPPNGSHSVWWFFHDDGSFAFWYINLEQPVARWAGGVDSFDQALDVVVYPDGSYEWKDEDEFAERTGVLWDDTQAARIRDEGKAMIRLAQSQQFPFDGTWCDFVPEPHWEPSRLPWWWDQLPDRVNGLTMDIHAAPGGSSRHTSRG